MIRKIVKILKNKLKQIHRWIGEFSYRRFPYIYARYVYWVNTEKKLSYSNPEDVNEKLFWLHRYWQNPLIIKCADKLGMREYVRDCGLEHLLTTIYEIYDSADKIVIDSLPNTFVLKCNHGSGFNIICKDKKSLDIECCKSQISLWLRTIYGLETAEYQYQYIIPYAFSEEYIGDENDERLEIQFFCFNGYANHILVRNDLGDAAKNSFAISYNKNWQRVKERRDEDMTINIPRPSNLDELIEYAERLAKPFPHVRVAFILVGDRVYIGELTFTTHGNILSNYTDETLKKWGQELVLPKKLRIKWRNNYNHKDK